MPDEDQHQVMCATYTHARRHPLVLGTSPAGPRRSRSRCPSWRDVEVFIVEMMTWRFWGALLPQTLAIVIAVGLPWALAWAVRRARVEGRTSASAAGYLRLVSSPPSGQVGGRPYSEARRADLRATPHLRHGGRR